MEKEGGQRAIKALNGTKIEGKTLIVKISTNASYFGHVQLPSGN